MAPDGGLGHRDGQNPDEIDVYGPWRSWVLLSSYDQGIFQQVLWNSWHGRLFESTLSSQLSTNVIHAGELPSVDYQRLGQHFTPTLLLGAPLLALGGGEGSSRQSRHPE